MESLWGDGDCFPEELFPKFAWIILLCLHSALQSFQFEMAIFGDWIPSLEKFKVWSHKISMDFHNDLNVPTNFVLSKKVFFLHTILRKVSLISLLGKFTSALFTYFIISQSTSNISAHTPTLHHLVSTGARSNL